MTTPAAWTSSDAAVMRPTSTAGSFLAAGPGTARIIARYEGLESPIWMVVIDPALQTFPRVFVNPVHPGGIGSSIRVSAFLQQSLNASLQDLTSRVTWTSADPGVCTIDQNGILRGVGPGTTLITATLDTLTDRYWLSIPPS